MSSADGTMRSSCHGGGLSRGLACADDVVHAYNLFLGRDAESEAVIAHKVGSDLPTMLRDFVHSPEFLVRVRDRILSLERPTGAHFDLPPANELRRWAAQCLPLTRGTSAFVETATDWMEIYGLIFNDAVFVTAFGPSAELRPPFLHHIDLLRSDHRRHSVPEAQCGGPIWLLVTGAPRSGTGLLRVMLAQHENVALLKEYGLATLIERIDAIIGRPAIQYPDWRSTNDASDADFERVAAFYREHPGQRNDRTKQGQLRREDFDAVALGIFSALEPKKTLRVIGDKMPMTENGEDFAQLVSRLRGLKILVVLRNPAEVVASSLIRRAATLRGRDDWPVDDVHAAIAEWVNAWQSTLLIKARHPDAVHVVKYEDVCREPSKAIAEIDAFLGLPAHVPDAEVVVRPPELTLLEPHDAQVLRRHLGAVVQAWPSSSADELMRSFAALLVPYRSGTKVTLNHAHVGPCRSSGFSTPEPDGRWTDRPRAKIELFHGETTGVLLIELWIARAAVDEHGRCDVVLQAGFGAPRLFTFDAEGGRAAFAVRATDAKETGLLTLDVVLAWPDPTCRRGPRASGICVRAIRVTHLERVGNQSPVSPSRQGAR